MTLGAPVTPALSLTKLAENAQSPIDPQHRDINFMKRNNTQYTETSIKISTLPNKTKRRTMIMMLITKVKTVKFSETFLTLKDMQFYL